MDVKPLVCGGCSAMVPLGDGKVAKCPYCGVEVPIPAQYLSLRDDDLKQVEARKEAAEMISRLGSPLALPILVFQKLGVVAIYLGCTVFGLGFILGAYVALAGGGGDGVLGLIFALFVALISVPVMWEWLLHALADKLHVDLADRLSGFGAHLLFGVVVIVFLLVPLTLGAYAKRRIETRRRLQAMFASKPPTRPGGPATCRHCNAPLDVPAGALGARCLYCSTDNLVTVSSKVLRMTHVSAEKSHRAIKDAFSEEFSARYYMQARLKALPLLALVVVPLFGGIGLLTEVVMDEGSSPGHMTCASGTPMLYGEGAKRPQGEVTLDCGDECIFYVPLARGQTLVAHGGDSVVAQRRDVGHWYQLDWWSWTGLEPGPVKHTGWYRLLVRSSKPNQKLTWSVN